MTFANPAMLWALFALVAVVILSFWRLRPRAVTVPSVLLWKRVPERPAPLKHAHTPKASLELMLQMLAVAALAMAMADPAIYTKGRPAAQYFVWFDRGLQMREIGRAARAHEAMRRLGETGIYCEVYSTLEAARSAYRHHPSAIVKGLAAITDAGREKAEPGELWFIVGDACPNHGIIDVAVAGRRVTVTIFSNDDATVAVRCGEQRADVRVADKVACVTFDVAGAIALEPDTFSLDDEVNLRWVERSNSIVGLNDGNPHLIDAIVAMGLKPVVGVGDVEVVLVTSGAAWTPAELKVAEHEVTRDVTVGPVPEAREVQGDVPLIYADGKLVVALNGSQIVCGLALGRVGRGASWVDQAGFPIFWAQAIRFAGRGRIEEGRWEVSGLLSRDVSDLAQGPPSAPAQLNLDTSPRKRKLPLQAPMLVAAGVFMIAAWAAAARRRF